MNIQHAVVTNVEIVKIKTYVIQKIFYNYTIATEALSEFNLDLMGPFPESRGHRYRPSFTIRLCQRF